MNEKLTNIKKIANDEEWRVAKGYNKYYVSNYGRVFGVRNKKILKTCTSGNRYNKLFVHLLKDNGILSTISVANLVARTFLTNPNNYIYVSHLDNDETNNYYKNLKFTNKHTNRSADSDLHKMKSVIVLKDNKVVNTFESLTDFTNWLKENGHPKASISMVSHCLRGVNNIKTIYGYTLKYGDKNGN